jgi:hypothetical protein
MTLSIEQMDLSSEPPGEISQARKRDCKLGQRQQRSDKMIQAENGWEGYE